MDDVMKRFSELCFQGDFFEAAEAYRGLPDLVPAHAAKAGGRSFLKNKVSPKLQLKQNFCFRDCPLKCRSDYLVPILVKNFLRKFTLH